MKIIVPVSVGEIVDKISILEIKTEQITVPEKLANIERELKALRAVFTEQLDALPNRLSFEDPLNDLKTKLKQVNQQLWDIEDAIRDQERRSDFGAKFTELARAVYKTNDQRSKIKRELNELLGSEFIEEKSYSDYD